MKVFAFIVLAISALALAGEQHNPEGRAAHVPVKDNRNLKYIHNVPLAKSPEDVKKENESS